MSNVAFVSLRADSTDSLKRSEVLLTGGETSLNRNQLSLQAGYAFVGSLR